MTKYEWERELEKNLHTLSKDEIKRVLEYYNELFMDKIERGGTETSIIAEFGNPFDVANKIIAETSDGGGSENKIPPSYCVINDSIDNRGHETHSDSNGGAHYYSEPNEASAPSAKSGTGNGTGGASEKKSGGLIRTLVVVLLCILLGGVVVTVTGGLFAAAAGLTIGSVGLIIGGVVGAIGSLVAGAGVSIWAAVAQACACVMIAGIGIILMPLCIKLIIFMGKLLVKACKKVVMFITGNSEVGNEN